MVMGPNSRALLSRLTDADLSASAAPWMSLREIEIGGVMATALRVSFVGELGWELHVDDADLIELYEALWSVGADLGLRDFGSYALNSMRVEKGYHGWGSEFGVEYTPFDVGLDRFLDLDKPDFIGRDAVRAMADQPPGWSYGVWTIDPSSMPGPVGDPPPSAPIRVHGEAVGFVTSAAMGFRTGKRVCLGYVEGRHSGTTEGFTIDGYGADLPAVRHSHGIYDPLHERPRH
jgi:dimethylglycine dehydrogenase